MTCQQRRDKGTVEAVTGTGRILFFHYAGRDHLHRVTGVDLAALGANLQGDDFQHFVFKQCFHRFLHCILAGDHLQFADTGQQHAAVFQEGADDALEVAVLQQFGTNIGVKAELGTLGTEGFCRFQNTGAVILVRGQGAAHQVEVTGILHVGQIRHTALCGGGSADVENKFTGTVIMVHDEGIAGGSVGTAQHLAAVNAAAF